MFNVLFLQTIIIHPEKYNLPLSRCVYWDGEKEGISMESTWAPADLRILHYFTVYTHKWGYNETMIRCSLSSFSFAFYTNMICSCCCSRLVVIIAFFFLNFLTAPLLRSLWALFVYERGIKMKQREWEERR